MHLQEKQNDNKLRESMTNVLLPDKCDKPLSAVHRQREAKVLPPVSRFSQSGERTQKRDTVFEKFKAFFNRFWDISGRMVGE